MRHRHSLVAFAACFATLAFIATGVARADQPPPGREACVPGASGPPVGLVVAITGRAWAEIERCEAAAGRALTCGEAIYAGERVVTESEASLAFTIEQSQVYVAPGSELRVEVGAGGAADLELLHGRARVVDPDGATGAGRRLASGKLVSVGRGDTEISAIAGEPAKICEYALPLTIGASLLAPGDCVGPQLSAHAAAGIGVSLADAGRCDLADDDFDPFDVASGPCLAPFPPPPVPPPPPPSCAFGTCTPVPPVPPTPPSQPPGVIESPGINEPPPL